MILSLSLSVSLSVCLCLCHEGSLKGVLIKYQGCFMQVSCIGSFKGVKVVSGDFQELLEAVLREFQG